MNPPDSSVRLKSFQDLKIFLEKRMPPLPLEKASAPGVKRSLAPVEIEAPKTERQIFLDAMRGVTPLPHDRRDAGLPRPCPPADVDGDPDAAVVRALETLVNHGVGFIVSQTPEYIEGKAERVHPTVLKRLHRGDFSIQAHIDLHGLTVDSALRVFEKFLKTSIMTGCHAVLIVHGRGLSSPGEPVLKSKVHQWLTSGYWRKWVIAFSSARSCDGGAGATYVLLRRRPLGKRFRRTKH